MLSIRNRGRGRRPLRSALALVAAVAVAVTGLTFGTIAAEQTTTGSASAASAGAFDPGNIISDANFYNGSAMSASSVQSFLNSVAPNCRQASGGPACLKNFSQNMSSIAAVSGRCSAIGGGVKSAATMIAQVGAACGISQKVLLVLLQKEQGIVTTSSPTSYMYLHATGFACPDTAPCDPAYFGFGQQVYAAALQFKRYQASPTYWAYQAGRNNSILYNPNASCGRKTVYIQNQATAGLYIYTPYVPNTAAMNNLYGTGDSCSAYGNRNFWRMYTDWFGSPTGGSSPYGNVDSVTAASTNVTVTGWAVDPDTTNPLRVAFYVDGVGKRTVTADQSRTDLAGSLGSNNTNHGFSAALTGIAIGNHSVCTFAINQGAGANSLLGCNSVTVASAPPKGVLDTVQGGSETIKVSGWVLDPDSSTPAWYKVQVDGVGAISANADQKRSDVARVYPGVGTTLGFSRTITNVTPGPRTVSLWTQDKPGSVWKKVAEKSTTVTAPTTGPTGKKGTVYGHFDGVTGSTNAVSIRGWAIDPDVYDAVRYKVHIDGVGAQAGVANGTRTDVERVHPGWGSDVGLSTTVTGVAAGKHTVTVWYQDRPSGTYRSFGTKSVTVSGKTTSGSTTKPSTTKPTESTPTPSATPKPTTSSGPVKGRFDTATGGTGTIRVTGWAIDPDTQSPVRYKLHLDGKGAAAGTANGTRSDVERAYPGWGSDVGLDATLTGVPKGTHTVRVWYQDLPGGRYVDFGTKTVTVR